MQQESVLAKEEVEVLTESLESDIIRGYFKLEISLRIVDATILGHNQN